MNKSYQKMLFKALASDSEAKDFVESDNRIGYIIVDSLNEEREKNKEGWGNLKTQKEKLLKTEKPTAKGGLALFWKVALKILTITAAISTIVATVVVVLSYIQG